MYKGISDEGIKRIAKNTNRKAVVDDVTFDRVDRLLELLDPDEFITAVFKFMSREEADSTLDFLEQTYDVRDEDENFEDYMRS